MKTLGSLEDFQDFIDTPITFEKGGEEVTALKVVGLYSKRDELDDELKEFKKAAVKHSIYRDLQFALVINKSEPRNNLFSRLPSKILLRISIKTKVLSGSLLI